jgi:hypothetical protein
LTKVLVIVAVLFVIVTDPEFKASVKSAAVVVPELE